MYVILVVMLALWGTPLAAAPAIGVNYHATGADFGRSAFLTRYHQREVRALVRRQLADMARQGVDAVKTTIWLTADGRDGSSDALPATADDRSFAHHFPLTPRERANLSAYVKDVGTVRRPDGRRMRLQLAIAWLWCADYGQGDAATTVGQCGLTWPLFLSRARQCAGAVLAAATPDGSRVVERVYLATEIMVGARRNEERFLTDLYPWFLAEAKRRGIEGSLYFLASGQPHEVFDSSFRDQSFSRLAGHRSLFWVWRSTEYLRRQGLPVPTPLAFSLYPDPKGRAPLILARVFADLQALYPNRRFAVAETDYPADPTRRTALAQAFTSLPAAAEPMEIFVWPTPNNYGPASAPPFSLHSFKSRRQPARARPRPTGDTAVPAPP